ASVHHAGRSPTAAACVIAMTRPTKPRYVAAGTQPGDRVHPVVVEAMREVGIDLFEAKPQRLTDALAKGASRLVTMGCGDECPFVPGAQRDDWPLPDPMGKTIEEVRAIRDEVRSRVERLAKQED